MILTNALISSVTLSASSNVFYIPEVVFLVVAGGGGGGNGVDPYNAGDGGGGEGRYITSAIDGIANTGGGGGGGGAGGYGPIPGGAGAAGIVIVTYPDSYPAAGSTTGSPTITVTNGFRYYAFISSGSITF